MTINTDNKIPMSSHLAANVMSNGTLEYCKNSFFTNTPNYQHGDWVEKPFFDQKGEITFFQLDSSFNYQTHEIDFGAINPDPRFKCYLDDGQLIVAANWGKNVPTFGFISPCTSPQNGFPAAGFLALAEAKRIYRNDGKALAAAKKRLFKSIGKVCYPMSQNPTKYARKLFSYDLRRQNESGEFLLKGTPIQHGTQCFINGDNVIFTDYGLAEIIDDHYGDLILDTAFQIHHDDEYWSISVHTHCNNSKGQTQHFSDSLCSELDTSSSDFKRLAIFLLNQYPEREVTLPCIFSGLLSLTTFDIPHLSLKDRWNCAVSRFASECGASFNTKVQMKS